MHILFLPPLILQCGLNYTSRSGKQPILTQIFLN